MEIKPYALLSVSDKTDLVPFASNLIAFGIGILSTGGTAKALREAGIEVTDVSEYTGFPEMMDGRLKTLHPMVHGGILGRIGTDDDVMRENGMVRIDFVVVNLYPFAATIAKPGCTDEQAIENIDIGGPTMIRAAAKNHARVTVIVDPADYANVIAELCANSDNPTTSLSLRRALAKKVYDHTSRYDEMIAHYL